MSRPPSQDPHEKSRPTHEGNEVHLPVLRRGLRGHHRVAGRADHRRAGRSRTPGELRPAVHQGLEPAPDGCRADHAPGATAASAAAREPRRQAGARFMGPGPGRGDRNFRARDPRKRPGCRRLLHLGPVADRGLLRLQQAGQGSRRHQQHHTNSRLCMSSAAAGYKLTLGADAPPNCYDDIGHAQCLFITGSNTAWAHPVLFRRIEDAKAANPHLKIIVCDPRRTDTAGIADLYLPIEPGTDVMLFNGLLHVMLWEGWVRHDYIAAHTSGFDELKASVRDCTPDLVAQVCGIRKEDLFLAAKLFATSSATLSLYCQGLNHSSSGTAKNAALINLHLATAQIGKPGAGPFSLTGQPNAMGGREVGGMANLLSAHRDLDNPQHRAEIAALWGVPSVPDKPGKTAVEMFQAAADGQIRALWIACTNPAQSMPDQATVRHALERAEFVLVQEAFSTTATCEFADLLLPATTWGEKTGTVTNSERRISRVRPATPKPAE